jgi:lipoprotein NlpD
VRADAPGEFAWPAKGKVIQGFGEARSTGIAIAAAPGDPVSAAADGKVIFSGQGPRGYGNLIIVKHDADTLSVYAHGRTLLVKEGQTVRKGQKIAEAGDSGADKPKLLFEIRKGGKPVDPLKLLPSK